MIGTPNRQPCDPIENSKLSAKSMTEHPGKGSSFGKIQKVSSKIAEAAREGVELVFDWTHWRQRLQAEE